MLSFCFVRQIVRALGGTLVDSIYECSHLVTDKVRRTVKLLCGVARGIPIVQLAWLEHCKAAKVFIGKSIYNDIFLILLLLLPQHCTMHMHISVVSGSWPKRIHVLIS